MYSITFYLKQWKYVYVYRVGWHLPFWLSYFFVTWTNLSLHSLSCRCLSMVSGWLYFFGGVLKALAVVTIMITS